MPARWASACHQDPAREGRAPAITLTSRWATCARPGADVLCVKLMSPRSSAFSRRLRRLARTPNRHQRHAGCPRSKPAGRRRSAGCRRRPRSRRTAAPPPGCLAASDHPASSRGSRCSRTARNARCRRPWMRRTSDMPASPAIAPPMTMVMNRYAPPGCPTSQPRAGCRRRRVSEAVAGRSAAREHPPEDDRTRKMPASLLAVDDWQRGVAGGNLQRCRAMSRTVRVAPGTVDEVVDDLDRNVVQQQRANRLVDLAFDAQQRRRRLPRPRHRPRRPRSRAGEAPSPARRCRG